MANCGHAVAQTLHDSLKPLAWLIGKWRPTTCNGHYPTIRNFTYKEHMEFFHVGQPSIQFSFYAFDESDTKPMHREVGFLRLQPGTNKVAFMSAHNNGVAEMEEGEVNGQELQLETTTVGRMSFGVPPAVQQLRRTFRRENDRLTQTINMETSRTPLCEHLEAHYQLVTDDR